MAQPIDRSQFKATSVAASIQADKQLETLTGNGKKGNADYLEIKSGTGEHNYRIYPPHPNEGELYAVPKAVHWIPKLVPKKDEKGNFLKDKDEKFIKEWKDGPIFNARIHGGQEKDIIEEYAAYAQKIAKETVFDPKDAKKDEELRKQFLEPIVGSPRNFTPGSPKPKHGGIIPLRQTWVMYAHELIFTGTGEDAKMTKVFGRLEIGRAVKERLNKIAASESSSEPLGTDPFTDLDDGKAIKIIYNSKATKAQDYYSTEIFAPTIPKSGGKIQLFPITDEDLAHWLTQTSLQKMFVNVYDADTFDDVLKGLKYFDDKNELGVFAYDEFLDICDQLLSKLPEGKGKKEESLVEEEQSGDQFDKMDRDELKEFNRENKLGIVPNKTMTDDAFRNLIREAISLKSGKKEEVKPEEKEEPKAVDQGAPDPGETGHLPFKESAPAEVSETGKVKTSVAERLKKLQAGAKG